MPSRLSIVLFAAILGGCSVARTPITTGSSSPVLVEPPDSAAILVDEVLAARSSVRVAELKSRGGPCAAYGSVLETSLQKGRVTVRSFMWRVGGRLVSGEANPAGDIVVARHIDRLNVGIRTVDDVVRSLEHEAAHLAFRISNGRDAASDQANAIVHSCRPGS